MVAPVALIMLLRVNAALVFLSLCLGDVLIQFVAKDTNDFMGAFTGHYGNADFVKLGLLVLPAVLTTVFMIRTVKGSRLLINLLPAVGVGLLGTLLVVPLLPPGTAANIVNSAIWQQIRRAEDLIVGSSALICLLSLWLMRPKTGGKHSKHH